MARRVQWTEASERLWLGIALILAGAVFLLDRLGAVELGRVWRWWPLIVIGAGMVRVLGWRSADRVASGLAWVMFGLWFLVSEFGWYGLSWSNSWPLALVAIGLGLIVRPALERLFDRGSAQGSRGGEPHATR